MLDLDLAQARDNLRQNCVCAGFDLRPGLVLNWVGNVNGIEIRTAQRRSLGSRGRAKLSGRYRYRRNSHVF